ncbi:MAG: efflux RND transporter permease subunit [Fusobacteriaceae bacterium]
MSITSLAIKNRVSTYLFVLLLCFFGVFAYLSSEKAEDPGYTIKTAVITTNWPGATAKQVAELVSKQIQDEVRSMESLDYVDSKNLPGQSNVYVNLKAKYWNPDPEWTQLRNKIEYVTPKLPQGVQKPIINTYFGDVYGTVAALSSKELSFDELYIQAEELKSLLLFKVPEIGQVQITGAQQDVIYVRIDNDKIATMGISLNQIVQSLQSANVILRNASILDGENRITINPSGTFNSVEDIGKVVLAGNSKDQRIYLQEIAKIEKGYLDPPSLLTYNGENKSIVLAISLSSGQNILKLGEGVKKVLDEYKRELPLGTDLTLVYNQSSIVDDKIAGFISSLIQAIIIIVAIMFGFLGIKSGLIVASLTPTTIAVTLIGLYIFGYGINQMTLAGLIIALGMLVDNAVVMAENIMVLSQKGMNKMDACLESAKALAIPLFTGSMTTAAAFLPVITNQESMGEYVGPMAIVVFIALTASWALNQTFIPLLCYDYLDTTKQKKIDFNNDKLYIIYRNTLILALKNYKTSMLLAIGSFVFGVFLFKFIPNSFMPAGTTPVMASYIRLPKGTSIETTNEVVKDLNKHIRENYYVGDLDPKKPTFLDYILTGGTTKIYEKDGIKSWESYVGGGGPRYTLGYTPELSLPEFAYVLYNVTSADLTEKYSSEINRYLQSKYPNITVTSKSLQEGPTSEFELGYQFISPNLELIREISIEVQEKLRNTPGVRVVTDNWGNFVPQIDIQIDYNKAILAGLTSSEIGEALQYSLQGFNSTSFYDFNAPPKNTTIPITVKGTRNYKDKLQSLKELEITNKQGQSVALQQVANLKLNYIPNFVYTRDLNYAIQVDAGIASGYTANDLHALINKWIKEKMANEWEAKGVQYKVSGMMKTSEANSKGLSAGLPIALLIMLTLVIAQFNSVKKGLIIMLTIPLSLLGCSLGLLITGLDLGFMAIVGVISLAGVVLNHSIILIDRITIEKEELKRTDQDSIVIGCQARLRPILLTVFTTLAGLLPLYFFGGPLFKPLAAVLMFGLMVDTVLSLGAIPVFYAATFGIKFKDYIYDPSLAED